MRPQPISDSICKEEKELPTKRSSEYYSNQVNIPRRQKPEKNPDEERKAQKINSTPKLMQSTISPPHNMHQKAIDHKESASAIMTLMPLMINPVCIRRS